MILSDAHVLQAGNNQELFSNSNCALTDDPFQFDLWTITKTSPGKSNEVECVGGHFDGALLRRLPDDRRAAAAAAF